MTSETIVRRLAMGAAGGLLLAASCFQPMLAARKDVDYAALDAQVSRLQAVGASQSAIDAVFAAHGLVRVDSGAGNEVTPFASTSNDVTMGQPSVYEDTRFSYFVATASFQWHHNCSNPFYYKNQCVAKECLFWDCGGPDGFGVRLNRVVNEIKTSFYTHDTDGNQTTWVNPETLNETGAGWIEQDSLSNGRYNWDGGNVYYMFDLATSCTRGTAYKAYSRLDHSWSNTNINGFGISATGFNVSWSSEGARWTATNAVTTYWYPCG
ncbi:MAG: hypothetical protein QOI92_2884 [Chloroflexota bacterium]|nr:hypothetical protein [Chloroflexota bacterium]